jgi:hypothetical protein
MKLATFGSSSENFSILKHCCTPERVSSSSSSSLHQVVSQAVFVYVKAIGWIFLLIGKSRMTKFENLTERKNGLS